MSKTILNDSGCNLTSLAVIKRNGTSAPWSCERIERAIALAYYSVTNGEHNPNRDNPSALYGLDKATFSKVKTLAQMVECIVGHRYGTLNSPHIEQIQDIVETCIASQGHWDVAKAYILYRAQKAESRLRDHSINGLQDYIAMSKYARYNESAQRREIWSETVARVRDMHLKTFSGDSELTTTINSVFESVEKRRVLPSMRSLQFGGKAIEASNARMYNCSFSYADRPKFFNEAFYLLMCGCGVGFSVQRHHVAKLDPLPNRAADDDLTVHHYRIQDSIEGWSDAVAELIYSYYGGYLVEFDFSAIRRRGSKIVTGGGKAPGHLPLKRCLEKASKLLSGATGRKLRPVEVYDLVMFISEAVLSGGIRRSATICLFSADDDEMASAKTGDWFTTNPQRAFSNNSAVLLRDNADFDTFKKLFTANKQFGEPGFYFTHDLDYGANPCVEIGLCPKITLNDSDVDKLKAIDEYGLYSPGDTLSGWQMCNLTTINGAAVTSAEDFYAACQDAATIGTLQASYTHIPYLGPVTKLINEREALLGVSICGIMDNPNILLDAGVLRMGAAIVRQTNEKIAERIGINPAARCTCVKPEGTASLLLGAASGIHPHHARRYFRRVQANRIEPVYTFFKRLNSNMTEPSAFKPNTDDVITFPVQCPDGAVTRDQVTAIQFLDAVKFVQENWVIPGTSDYPLNPGLYHNVSNTVNVKDDEWEPVMNYIWENRAFFTGIALIPASGDKMYIQAPREEVSTEEDIAKWNNLCYRAVDYAQMTELEDNTKLQQTAACAGGTCEL